MVLVSTRTRLRNRVHATLAKYGLTVTGVSDLFGIEGHKLLADKVCELPPHTRYATHQLLEHLDLLDEQVADLEERIRDVFTTTPAFEGLRTMPGVGFTLGVVILTAVGDVRRFPDAEHLATYAGTTPRIHSSGGKTRFVVDHVKPRENEPAGSGAGLR